MALKNVSKYNAEFMSLDNVCYFPPYDANNPVFCAELPITSTEFFNAGMLDIRATVSLVIDSESDTPTADRVKFNDVIYSIYRRYPRNGGLTQIYAEAKVGLR